MYGELRQFLTPLGAFNHSRYQRVVCTFGGIQPIWFIDRQRVRILTTKKSELIPDHMNYSHLTVIGKAPDSRP